MPTKTPAIWKSCAPSSEATNELLRKAVLHRLIMTDGHINATERYLWHNTERGFWSADQAVARIAEVFLWLHKSPRTFPKAGHYLKGDQPTVLLKQLSLIKPDCPCLANIKSAQKAIIDNPFIDISGNLNATQKQELHEGLERKNHYIKALRDYQKQAEQAIADRFLALKVGNWLKLHDGHEARVLVIRQLTVTLFVPAIADYNHRLSIKYFSLWFDHLKAILPPEKPQFEPEHYWYFTAVDDLNWARELLSTAAPMDSVRDALVGIIDAISKAWLLRFAPDESQVWYDRIYLNHAFLLQGKAPPNFADKLIATAKRIQFMSSWAGNIYHLGKGDALQFGILLSILQRILDELQSSLQITRSDDPFADYSLDEE